jgi:hypothetical protein
MPFPPTIPKRHPGINLKTRRTHRREGFWQILLPMFAGVLVSGILFYLLLTGTSGSIERGAQIAVILLVVPAFFLGIGLLGLLVVLNGGLAKVTSWLPAQTARAQQAVESANVGLQKTASAIERSVMKVDSWGSAARKVFRRNK